MKSLKDLRIRVASSLVLLVFFVGTLFAKDSTYITSSVAVESKGQHILAAFAKDFTCVNCLRNIPVTDNPFHHFAIYNGINHSLTWDNKFSLETGIYLEERSHSGGNNTVANWVVFPRIVIQAQDSIRLNGKILKYKIKGGDYWDEDVSDIIRLYNIDYQALDATLSAGKYSIGFMTIGDLSYNVGLDLHQLYRFSVGYNQDDFSNILSLSLNELNAFPNGLHPTKTDMNATNYVRRQISEKVEVKGQIDVRLNSNLPTATALAIIGSYTSDKFKLKSALRYFDAEFNTGYFSRVPRYSQGNSYVGPQLYPLKNYFRPLSQWALYSEKRNTDIISFEVFSSLEQPVHKNLAFFYELDLNTIYELTKESVEVLALYNTGLHLKFAQGFVGELSLTNKHMDLNRSYQTFAISRMPFLSFGVQIQLNDLELYAGYLD